MKLTTYRNSENSERLGFYCNGHIYDMEKTGEKYDASLPSDILDYLNDFEANLKTSTELQRRVIASNDSDSFAEKGYELLAPVPKPPSCRDAYAFRQHVAAARKNRGVDMIPEFDQFPIFYFTNHNAIFGEGDVPIEKDHLEKLDFELELACVVGKRGKNLDASEADAYIAGFTVMNDWSARLLQMEEMKLNLGPAKGKDFATSIGPWLVTIDEFETRKIDSPRGARYDLTMKAKHNGRLISEGNAKDMTFTFAEILERCSYGVEIFPGDVIGSGTVGTGCYLELNGTRERLAKEKGESCEAVWLADGDEMELEIDRVGVLKNRVVLTDNNISILEKKKNI